VHDVVTTQVESLTNDADGTPALVVASSWGGAIATLALATGVWTGPTVLLAPAYAKAIGKQCNWLINHSFTYNLVNDW
jgi:alpha-beta hydrolase superfamily lysophospholipase